MARPPSEVKLKPLEIMLSSEQFELLNRYWKNKGFASRNEAIRAILRKELEGA